MLILSFKINRMAIMTINVLQSPFLTPRNCEKSAKTREKQGKKSAAQNGGEGKEFKLLARISTPEINFICEGCGLFAIHNDF